jgi:hypothetical protein
VFLLPYMGTIICCLAPFDSDMHLKN